MRRAFLVVTGWLLLASLAACSAEEKKLPPDGSVAADVTQLDFGPVFLGETATRTLRVQNRGRTAGAVTVEIAAPFVANAEGSLAPGNIGTITVSFTPVAGESASGTLTLSIPGVPGKVEIPVTGEGTAREIELDRTLNLGVADLGTTSATELPIKNPSGLAQVVTAAISDPEGAFRLDQTRLLVPAGQVAPFTLRFTPGVAKSYSAQMQVQACETCEAITVLLSATGRAREVHVAPMNLDFGAVPPGRTATQPVHLFNSNVSPIEVTSIRLVAGPGSPFSVELPELPQSLPPGQLDIPVTFAPAARVPSSAKLRIEAAGAVLEVAISGVGSDGGLLAKPLELAFGTVPASVQPQLTVNFTDTTTGVTHIVQSVRVEGEGATRFLASAARLLPTVISNAPLDVKVTFQTSQPGTYEAELVLELEDGTQRRVPLSGTAVSGGYCDLELEPAALHFGLQPFEQPVERTVVLRNPTSLECTAGPFTLSGSPDFTIPGMDLTQRRLIAVRGTLEIKVRYTPSRGGGTGHAALEIEQTNLTVSKRTVTIDGTGSEPFVELAPATASFAKGSVGAEQLMAVDLHNVSPIPLRIVSERLVPTSGEVAIVPAPGLLPEGETVTTHVLVRPSSASTVANLEIELDGASAPVIVPITAPRTTDTCGAACPGPVVSCPANVSTWLQRDHVLTGGAAAGATSCGWAVVSAPAGSTAVPAGHDCSAVFRPDVTGTYDLEMTASNKALKTATCHTKLQVASFPGIWIESRSRVTKEAVDMHLFLPTAGSLAEAGTWTSLKDHAWKVRPRPDWSGPGLDDDPIVENGAAGFPAVARLVRPISGTTYEVGIHWATARSAKELDVDTTIWCNGAVVSVLSTHLAEPYTATHVGSVHAGDSGSCTFTPANTSILVQP